MTLNLNLKSGILLLGSVLLTLLTFVLGAIPLLAFRRASGRSPFLLSVGAVLAIGASAQAWFFVLAWALISILVEMFVEMEKLGYDYKAAGILAVFISSMGALGGFLVLKAKLGLELLTQFRSSLESLLLAASNGEGNVKAQVGFLVQQIPSAVVILLIIGLGLAVYFEPKLSLWMGAKKENSPERKLGDFKLPDFLIWVFILGVLFTFVEMGQPKVKLLATNVLNVSLLLYFLQGLAVLTFWLNRLKVGPFGRTFILLMVLMQLFLVVSFLGVMDFWFSFRTRTKKGTTQIEGKV